MTRRKNPSTRGIDHAPGTRFGLVTVLGPGSSYGCGRVYRVRCDCGVERETLASSLRQHAPTTHRECNRQRERGAAPSD